MKTYLFFDNKETLERWLKNAVFFSAPALAVFFAQLQSGVDMKTAFLVALLAFYGTMADLMKKVGEEHRGK